MLTIRRISVRTLVMNAPAQDLAVQWFERVWQQRSREAIFELMSETAVGHPEGGQIMSGSADFARMHEQFMTAFPDLSLRILHAVGGESEACVHWEVRGTQMGAFGPLPATRELVAFTGMTYLVFQNGKIIEGWDCWDQSGLVQTLAAKSTE